MSNEKTVLFPAAVELISNVSGVYSAPFWDDLRQVTGSLDTIRKIKSISVYNIGTGLAMEGKKVLIMDVDPQGDLTKMLGERPPTNYR